MKKTLNSVSSEPGAGQISLFQHENNDPVCVWAIEFRERSSADSLQHEIPDKEKDTYRRRIDAGER